MIKTDQLKRQHMCLKSKFDTGKRVLKSVNSLEGMGDEELVM